jgi:hypothetical protein
VLVLRGARELLPPRLPPCRLPQSGAEGQVSRMYATLTGQPGTWHVLVGGVVVAPPTAMKPGAMQGAILCDDYRVTDGGRHWYVEDVFVGHTLPMGMKLCPHCQGRAK